MHGLPWLWVWHSLDFASSLVCFALCRVQQECLQAITTGSSSRTVAEISWQPRAGAFPGPPRSTCDGCWTAVPEGRASLHQFTPRIRNHLSSLSALLQMLAMSWLLFGSGRVIRNGKFSTAGLCKCWMCCSQYSPVWRIDCWLSLDLKWQWSEKKCAKLLAVESSYCRDFPLSVPRRQYFAQSAPVLFKTVAMKKSQVLFSVVLMWELFFNIFFLWNVQFTLLTNWIWIHGLKSHLE